MKKGEKAELTLSAAYAYGDAGSPPKIPAAATLVRRLGPCTLCEASRTSVLPVHLSSFAASLAAQPRPSLAAQHSRARAPPGGDPLAGCGR